MEYTLPLLVIQTVGDVCRKYTSDSCMLSVFI